MRHVDDRIGRRALLAGSAATVGAAAATHLLPEAAGASLSGPRVVVTDMTSTGINAAISAMPVTGGAVQLLDGIYTVTSSIVMNDNVALVGAGRAATVLQLAPGANTTVIVNGNLQTGNANMTLRGFTVDGNRAAQSPATPTQGIELHQPPGGVLDDIEVHDCTGVGIWFSGDGQVIRASWLSNLFCHDNSLDGMFVTWASREVHYTAITCDLNGRDGLVIDHSEGLATGIHAHRNVRDGIHITNVVSDNLVGLSANLNGRNGIRASGFIDSVGAAWTAHTNGLLEPAADVYFDGVAGSYGLTNRAVVHGIDCGPVSRSTWGSSWPSPQAATETYGLQVDPAIVGSLVLLGVRSAAGKLGQCSFPPVTTPNKLVVVAFPPNSGDLQVLRGNLAILNGNLAHGANAKAGFFGAPAVKRPVVSGSRNDGTAVASLLSALTSLGLITDTTTA